MLVEDFARLCDPCHSLCCFSLSPPPSRHPPKDAADIEATEMDEEDSDRRLLSSGGFAGRLIVGFGDLSVDMFIEVQTKKHS